MVLSQSREGVEVDAAQRALSDDARTPRRRRRRAGLPHRPAGGAAAACQSLFGFDHDTGRLERDDHTRRGRAAAEPEAPGRAPASFSNRSSCWPHRRRRRRLQGRDRPPARRAPAGHHLRRETSPMPPRPPARRWRGATRTAPARCARRSRRRSTTSRAAARPRRSRPPRPFGTDTAEDDEMLDIFFEEADKVIASARQSLTGWPRIRSTSNSSPLRPRSTPSRAARHGPEGSAKLPGRRSCQRAPGRWRIEAEPSCARSPGTCSTSSRAGSGADRPNATGFHSAPIVAAANACATASTRTPRGQAQAPASVESTAVLPPSVARTRTVRGRLRAAPEEAGDTEILEDFASTASGALDEAAAAPPRAPADGFTLNLPATPTCRARRAGPARARADAVPGRRPSPADGRRADRRRAELRIRPRRSQQEHAGAMPSARMSRRARSTRPTTSTTARPVRAAFVDKTLFDPRPTPRIAEPAANAPAFPDAPPAARALRHAHRRRPAARRRCEERPGHRPLRMAWACSTSSWNRPTSSRARLCTSLAQRVLEVRARWPGGRGAGAFAGRHLVSRSATPNVGAGPPPGDALEVSQFVPGDPPQRGAPGRRRSAGTTASQFAAGFLDPAPRRFVAWRVSTRSRPPGLGRAGRPRRAEARQRARDAEAGRASRRHRPRPTCAEANAEPRRRPARRRESRGGSPRHPAQAQARPTAGQSRGGRQQRRWRR